MPRLEQQMGVGAVGDRRAVEADADPARRRLEQDSVVGIVVEAGCPSVDQLGHRAAPFRLPEPAAKLAPEALLYRVIGQRATDRPLAGAILPSVPLPCGPVAGQGLRLPRKSGRRFSRKARVPSFDSSLS